jgi:uncharacterized membrane protein YidH (DUF202 family)
MQMAEQTLRNALALDDSTRIAYESMRASYEKIMMSWIGTATSLINFGFSVHEFFRIEAPSERHQNCLIGLREFVLALVSMAVSARNRLGMLDSQQ